MGSVQHIDGGEIKNEANINGLALECLEATTRQVNDGDVCGVIVIRQHSDGSTTATAGGFIRNSRVIGEMMMQVARLTNG